MPHMPEIFLTGWQFKKSHINTFSGSWHMKFKHNQDICNMKLGISWHVTLWGCKILFQSCRMLDIVLYVLYHYKQLCWNERLLRLAMRRFILRFLHSYKYSSPNRDRCKTLYNVSQLLLGLCRDPVLLLVDSSWLTT